MGELIAVGFRSNLGRWSYSDGYGDGPLTEMGSGKSKLFLRHENNGKNPYT